jgi:CRISPR-associated protein Csb2
VPLRVPTAGYIDALRAAHDDGVRSWQAGARTLAYAPRFDQPEPVDATAADGPYGDLLVWGVSRPAVAIRGDDVLTVTNALRRAVLKRVADPVPAQVCGHGADGRAHVAYLGLVDVGHDRADGHLLGVGIAVPRDMPVGERRALLGGLLGENAARPIQQLHAGRSRVLDLQYAPATGWGLRPERWQRTHGCRWWVTATPLMLDRYPKNPRRSSDVADSVAAALVTAGYPEPAVVQPLDAPVVIGGIHQLRAGSQPRRPRRPILHCRVGFDRPVRGPVLAGALRYLGGGLFVPETADAHA